MKKNKIIRLKVFIPTFLVTGTVFSFILKTNPFGKNIDYGYKTNLKTITYDNSSDNVSIKNNSYYIPNDLNFTSFKAGNTLKTSVSKSFNLSKDSLSKLSSYVEDGNIKLISKNYNIPIDKMDDESFKMKLTYPESIDYNDKKLTISRNGYATLFISFAAFCSGLFACTCSYDDNKVYKKE